MRITDLIAQDHRTVRALFLELEPSEPSGRRSLLERIVTELEVHAQAEEQVFYPAVRAVSRRVDDAEAGHMHVRALVDAAKRLDPASPEFVAGVRQLERAVLNHAAEEEGGMFLEAYRLGAAELERLGGQMMELEEALKRARGQRATRAA
jgi:hemerythrin superfamily protein